VNISFKQNWQDDSTLQHWCPKSQAFAPAQVLLQYLQTGWNLGNAVKVVQYHLTGDRHVDVYHFKLYHRDERLEMPVLANPVVLNVVSKYRLMVTNTVDRYDPLKRKHENALPSLNIA